MKQQTPARGKGPNKRRPTREELNQQARDRKRQKKHRGLSSGSRNSESRQANSGNGGKNRPDPRLGSKKPVALGVSASAAPKAEKMPVRPQLSPAEELEKLETDPKLDALLDRIESGEAIDKKDRDWVNARLDRINELMQQLGLSFDEEDEDEGEGEEDLMRLLKGSD
ncbi:GTPase-activating protein [Erwinia sp. CPCC 100877]|nr:GTPase-activating protein [Erwinia sp. CPCC 100877]